MAASKVSKALKARSPIVVGSELAFHEKLFNSGIREAVYVYTCKWFDHFGVLDRGGAREGRTTHWAVKSVPACSRHP